jgi:cyclic beta-1,2-glucan synthetase
MGTGDWNDGMSRVGVAGKGESVWMAWFLCDVLAKFAPIAVERGDAARASAWRTAAQAIARAGESAGWDGRWYRRAYFDDGTPLGTRDADACAIDSIAQSWAVISGAAPRERARLAMESLAEQLVRPDDALILLLTPPFDHTALEPGYIKGYVPGVRENGGQYTHAAAWAIIAFAELGDGDRAGELMRMLNPIHRAASPGGAHRYRIEPYVVPGDVYAAPHAGRGGWSWYTGSAAWLYRAGIEWMLGLRVRAGRLTIDPCIPKAWPGFSMTFRWGDARYEISVENPHGVSRGVLTLELDGSAVDGAAGIALATQAGVHAVRVVLGPPTPAP